MRRTLVRTIAGTVAISMAVCASAAGPTDAIKARQANFKQIAKANKAIQDELKKDAPSLQVVQANAKTIRGLAAKIPSLFPHGSGPEAGVETEARPIIWQQTPKFRQSASNLAGAARALGIAAGKNDLAATKAAAGSFGQNCKACHDVFREKK